MKDHRALIVGVGGDLPGSVADAEGLHQILTDPERCAFSPGNVQLLTKESATRQGILDGLKRLADAGSTGTVIMFFSGHGYQVESPTGEAYFLIPHGCALAKLHRTAVSGKELAEALAAIPARRLLLVLDCCHAGGFAEERAKPAGLLVSRSPLPPEAASLFSQGKGRVIIASCRQDELSYEGDPYGLFTRALIEALAGEGVAREDGYVRVLDLALHAREKVPQWTSDKQHPIADVVEEADNFVVAYYAAGGLEPKGLDLPPVNPAEVKPPGTSGHGGVVRIGAMIHTGGGAYIAGSVDTGGGKFVGRDDHSQTVTHTGASLEELGKLLGQLEALLPQLALAPEDQETAEQDLKALKAQIAKPEARAGGITSRLNTLKGLLEGAAGAGTAATALIPLLQRAGELIANLFR